MGQKTSLGSRLLVEEGKRCSCDVEEVLLGPALGGDEQRVRQHRVGIGHARLEPLPIGPQGTVVAFGQPPRRRPGHGFQRFDVFRLPHPKDVPRPGSRTPGPAGFADRRAWAVPRRSTRGPRHGSRRASCCRALPPGRGPPGPGYRRSPRHRANGGRNRENCGTPGRCRGHTPGSSGSSSPGPASALRGADSRDERRAARPGRCRRSCSRSPAGERCRWHVGSSPSSRSCDPGDPKRLGSSRVSYGLPSQVQRTGARRRARGKPCGKAVPSPR